MRQYGVADEGERESHAGDGDDQDAIYGVGFRDALAAFASLSLTSGRSLRTCETQAVNYQGLARHTQRFGPKKAGGHGKAAAVRTRLVSKTTQQGALTRGGGGVRTRVDSADDLLRISARCARRRQLLATPPTWQRQRQRAEHSVLDEDAACNHDDDDAMDVCRDG